MKKLKLAVAVGGSSGAIYARVLFDRLVQLQDQLETVAVVMSDNGKFNWKFELGDEKYQDYPFDFYGKNDFSAPIASGSSRYDGMLVCPCSMGLLARIATGISNDLLTRAADVMLKERRRLILVPREKPFNRIHLQNMLTATDAGAIIVPAIPSFYGGNQTVDELIATVVDRALDLMGLEVPNVYRWGETERIDFE